MTLQPLLSSTLITLRSIPVSVDIVSPSAPSLTPTLFPHTLSRYTRRVTLLLLPPVQPRLSWRSGLANYLSMLKQVLASLPVRLSTSAVRIGPTALLVMPLSLHSLVPRVAPYSRLSTTSLHTSLAERVPPNGMSVLALSRRLLVRLPASRLLPGTPHTLTLAC
jgi:hypothetical protein